MELEQLSSTVKTLYVNEKIQTWKMLYLTWLISMQVFSAAGLLESRDLNLKSKRRWNSVNFL